MQNDILGKNDNLFPDDFFFNFLLAREMSGPCLKLGTGQEL